MVVVPAGDQMHESTVEESNAEFQFFMYCITERSSTAVWYNNISITVL